VHHLYNEVSNQKDTKMFRLLIFFKLALHVLGDRFGHPQEHFWLYTQLFGTMHWHCCRQVPRAPVGSSVPPHPAYQPAASSVHYTTSCKHSLVLLRTGEIIARNTLS